MDEDPEWAAVAPDTPAAQPNQIIVADDRVGLGRWRRVRTFDGPVADTIRRRITDSL